MYIYIYIWIGIYIYIQTKIQEFSLRVGSQDCSWCGRRGGWEGTRGDGD